MKVTLQNIADISGFSITTVSRALAGYSDVSERTRQKIQKIADDLGYIPNEIARSLQSQKSNSIGMVFPMAEDFSNSFFMELIAGVAHALSHYHYDLLLSAKLPGEQELKDYQRLVTGSRVDGIIVARTLVNDPRIEYLQSRNFPFVVSGHDDNATYPYIDVDGFDAFYKLTRHFIDLGHRHIAIINGPLDFSFANRRYEGYQQALADYDIPFDPAYVVESDMTKFGGIESTIRLLECQHPPTAIIACNDLMALGSMQALRQNDLTPGLDVAIGGFDDLPLAEAEDPPLTTIRQPIQNIGHQLVDMLIAIIRDKPLVSRQILIEPELIIRESSGSPLNI